MKIQVSKAQRTPGWGGLGFFKTEGFFRNWEYRPFCPNKIKQKKIPNPTVPPRGGFVFGGGGLNEKPSNQLF